MEEKWLVSAKRADFDAIASKYNIDKVLARILRNRDLISDEDISKFLNGTLKDLNDGSLMQDMDKALFVLEKSIEDGEKIRIIGDYDVDGICASFILLRALKALLANVDTVIPNRLTDGYGLNDSLVENAKNDGVKLILTCDNGIAASPQTHLAYEYDIRVIITDHHEVPYDIKDGTKCYILPQAEAVVDPKREDCNYPFSGICGAVVAYKLVELLFKGSLGRKRLTKDAADKILNELLSFAALATVCDVMELKDENRIMVKYGLAAMNKTENLGLKALLTVNGLEDKALTYYHAGFILGPCLNATGRLDTARRAIELFCAESFSEAVKIATNLKELNDSRKKMTEDGAKEAVNMVLEGDLGSDRVLVIYLPDCHESIAGIIAGRVKEYFNKPTFVITNSADGLKGSGRSIEGYDMYDELSKVKELFTRFGGHKMAAGISLSSVADMNEMRKRLNENCKLTPDDLAKKIHIDVPMPLSYITMELVESFDILEPFGTGNPKPVFADKNISLISYTKLGKNKNVGKFKISDTTDKIYEMIYFGALDKLDEYLKEKFGEEAFTELTNGSISKGRALADIIYYPEINEFRGSRRLQIVMTGIR